MPKTKHAKKTQSTRTRTAPPDATAKPKGSVPAIEIAEMHRLTEDDLLRADTWYMNEIKHLFERGQSPTRALIIRAIESGEIDGELCVFRDLGIPLEVWRFTAKSFWKWCRTKRYLLKRQFEDRMAVEQKGPPVDCISRKEAIARYHDKVDVDYPISDAAAGKRIDRACEGGEVIAHGKGRDKRIEAPSLRSFLQRECNDEDAKVNAARGV